MSLPLLDEQTEYIMISMSATGTKTAPVGCPVGIAQELFTRALVQVGEGARRGECCDKGQAQLGL